MAVALLLGLLTALPQAWQTTAQTATAPSFAYDQVSNAANKNEFPRIALGNTTLYTTWKTGTPPSSSRTSYSFRDESGTTWPAQKDFGGLSQGSYQTSSVAVSPKDGSVHLVWAEPNGVYYAPGQSNGAGTPVKISTSGTFPHFPHVTVDKLGRIWAVWSAEQPKGSDNIFYRYSADGGATWLPQGGDGLIESNNSKNPWIAADQTGGVHVVYNYGSPDWDIRYAVWDGSKWVKQTLRSTGISADASITIDPSNNIHVTWRQQRGFAQFSVYYATKPVGSGSWSVSNLYDGDNINKTVAIFADASGGLHVTWMEINHYDIFYIYKPAGGSWLSPVAKVTNDSRVQANPDVVASTATGLVHIVYEDWDSESLVNIRHAHAVVSTAAEPSATPQLPAHVKASPVAVSFIDIQRSPTELRWRWGAPPTDTANDSGGWVPFANPKSIPLPAISNSTCQPLTLYTQVRSASATQTGAKTATTSFDNAVQANVRIVNPFLAGLPQTLAQVSDVGVSDSDGAYDGDPSYTRIPQFFLSISDAGDCSGLTSFTVPASNFSGSIANGQYQNKVALPQAANTAPGSTQTIGVSVLDGLGNFGNYSAQLTYDPANTVTNGGTPNSAGLPVLHSGAVGADNGNSIIRTLSFSNVNVTDNVYGIKENLPSGRQFWGVWIANSRSPNLDVHDQTLKWFPVRVPSPNSSFTVQWDLFTGLNIGPDRTKTGDYYVYVRFLDGAGNATNTMLTPLKVTLQPGYTIPTYYLPVVHK
jgi:hypothetical protein